MLIDKSYFIGPLSIAQLGHKNVVDNLNNFINTYEPKILQAVLGYDLYEAFIAGIDVGSDENIDQRWLDLLNGVVFTGFTGIKKKWVGFAGGGNTSLLSSAVPEPLFITAGVTPGFPVGGYQYTNTALSAWNFSVAFRGIGPLVPETEWTEKSGGGITLVNTNYLTQAGEIWIITYLSKKVSVLPVSSISNVLSPLASRIFALMIIDSQTQNAGIGVVQPEAENAANAGIGNKLYNATFSAWQEFNILWEYLRSTVGAQTYPEFSISQVQWMEFKPINTFGI